MTTLTILWEYCICIFHAIDQYWLMDWIPTLNIYQRFYTYDIIVSYIWKYQTENKFTCENVLKLSWEKEIRRQFHNVFEVQIRLHEGRQFLKIKKIFRLVLHCVNILVNERRSVVKGDLTNTGKKKIYLFYMSLLPGRY